MISKVNNIQILLFLFVWIQVIPLQAESKIRFNSKKIKEIFGMLPEVFQKEIEIKSTTGKGTYYMNCKQIAKNRNLIFRVNQYHELEHLGFYLIDDDKSSDAIREVFDYLENIFLVSALLKEKSVLNQEIARNKIEVLYNGASLNQSKSLNILPQLFIDKNTPLKIKYDSRYFVFSWTNDQSNTLDIKIPNDYFLITQKTKDELEKEILRKMNTVNISKVFTERPLKNQLVQFDRNIYSFPGEIYSKAPELSSTKYFILNDSISPVFNSKYYKESLRNLLLGIVPTSLELRLKQKLYGGNEEEILININRFFYLFQPGNKFYFGWQNDDKENLKASIFISNEIYNFTHLLVVTTNSKNVFRKNGEIEGLFFAYVPKEKQK